ncbi:MAG TPA: sugar transferase [Candidatus Paceibacterota bacterium]|nr:sugar transferase [Candidatus Paceibacterota bacterium]
MKRRELAFNVLRVPVDYAALVLAGLATYVLRTQVLDVWRPVLFSFNLPLSRYALLVLGVSALLVSVYAVSGLYSMRVRLTTVQEVARVFVATSAGILAVILFIFLRQELFDSRFLIIGYWFVAFVFVASGRVAFRYGFRSFLSRHGWGRHRVMIIGNDGVTDTVARTVADDPAWAYDVVKRLADPDIEEVRAAVGNPGVDEVILANPDYPAERIVALVDFCHERHIAFSFVPNIYQTLTTHYQVDAIGKVPVVQLMRTSLDGWGRVFKRAMDVSAAALGLVLLSPVLAAVAFAIKWETAGPVFVGLTRVSGTREFRLYKFRSMIENAEILKPFLAAFNERSDGPLFKMRDDPRVTRTGRFIRRFRLDELPQLYNVLRGDISLVGPRPHQPDEIARYRRHHKKLLAIKAGATGLAQVSGSSDLPFEEEVQLDTFYIENWSLGMDVRIICRTALKMLSDRSAV